MKKRIELVSIFSILFQSWIQDAVADANLTSKQIQQVIFIYFSLIGLIIYFIRFWTLYFHGCTMHIIYFSNKTTLAFSYFIIHSFCFIFFFTIHHLYNFLFYQCWSSMPLKVTNYLFHFLILSSDLMWIDAKMYKYDNIKLFYWFHPPWPNYSKFQ